MTRRELVAIPMADGVELSATLFFPEGDGPWPAVMEALPYRKDDLTAAYRPGYAELADAGYVVCWLDVRGTGSSGGIATDEYSDAERADLVAVVDHLATRDWSTGAVGMFGTSYGGFTSLQVAAERPPALKAIVPIFASDDRYTDDVHHFGGALKQLDVVDYPTYMVAMNALPPVPKIWGEGWREEWDRRVDALEPWVLPWIEHQRRDAYWRRGSVRESIEDIEAATMIVGGWADGYTNIAFRSFPRFRAPVRLLIGPWAHAATETSLPGPNIRLNPELVRWFDRWLKGIDNGIDREPPIVVFAQRSTVPDPLRREVRGVWRSEPGWPPARAVPTELALAKAEPGGLASADGGDELAIRGDVGASAWISCAGVMPWVQPADQRPDEERSLTYTWEPLEEELEILGHPRLQVRIASSVPVAYLSAKVCDVFPDGSSSLVVRGLLNLTHRDGSEHPTPMPYDAVEEIDLELEACSWTFEEGHRIRLISQPRIGRTPGRRRSPVCFRSIATRASSSSPCWREPHRSPTRRSSFPRRWNNAIPTNRVTETGGAATSMRLTTSSAQRPATAGSLPAGNTDRRSLSDTRAWSGSRRAIPVARSPTASPSSRSGSPKRPFVRSPACGSTPTATPTGSRSSWSWTTTAANATGGAGNGRSPGRCSEGGPPSGASDAAADGARTPETRNPGAMAGAGLDEVPR